MLIRASIGTLAKLGMVNIKMLESPKTAYLLQYSPSGCIASCTFCPQSKESTSSKEMLSRIRWPLVDLNKLINLIFEKDKCFERICIQNVLKEGFEEELLNIIQIIKQKEIKIPISLALSPVDKSFLQEARRKGVDGIGIGLDAASPKILIEIRKPYDWNEYWDFINRSIEVFGRRKVNVHLIFGLGETELEFVSALQKVYDAGAEASLFPFTPVPGTRAECKEKPHIVRYRVMQIIRYLLSKGFKLNEIAYFEGEKTVLIEGPWLKGIKEAFLTAGCPGCNRPFYNESPSLIYNYPSLTMLEKDLEILKDQLSIAGLNLEVI